MENYVNENVGIDNVAKSGSTENLLVEATSVTPYIFFDAENGVLQVSGRSSPDNSLQFYSSLQNFIEQYFGDQVKDLQVNVNLEYFNTSSLKCIFQILKKLSEYKNQGSGIEVNWFYEDDDEDMLETGEDIADLLDLDFNFISDESEFEQLSVDR